MADYPDVSSDDDFGNFSNASNCSQYPNEYCESSEDYEDRILQKIYPNYYEYAFICAHIIVFIMGIVGNALVCVAVFRNTSMRTVTNYFIVNLAVADFLVILVCQPPTVLWDVTLTWFFGETFCKIILYFQTVAVSVSTLTLTVISIERWYAICHPLKFKSTTSRAKRLILLIWVISLIIDIPELVVLETIAVQFSDESINKIFFTNCKPSWSVAMDTAYLILRSLFLFILPLMLMGLSYYQIIRVLWSTESIPGGQIGTPVHNGNGNANGAANHQHHENGHHNAQLLTPILRGASASQCSQAEYQLKSRRKVAKMLMAVVIVFAVCNFPVHIYTTYLLTGMDGSDFLTCFAMISHWFFYANFAVNPVIYNFMSGKFRREFLKTFGCRKWEHVGRARGRRPVRRGRAQIRFHNNGSTGYVPRAGSTYTASYRYALRTEYTPTRSSYA